MQRIRLFRTRNESENTAAAVVDHNNSEIIRDVIVPKRIAVVHKTDIARNEQGIFLYRISRANRGACASVNSAGSPVAENSPGFIAFEQLRIANNGTVAQLQLRMVWNGCQNVAECFQVGKWTGFHKFLVLLQAKFFFMQPKMLVIAFFWFCQKEKLAEKQLRRHLKMMFQAMESIIRP